MLSFRSCHQILLSLLIWICLSLVWRLQLDEGLSPFPVFYFIAETRQTTLPSFFLSKQKLYRDRHLKRTLNILRLHVL